MRIIALRAAIEAAPVEDLCAVTTTLAGAYRYGEITEAEYEALQALIDLRRAAGRGEARAVRRKRVGSRPRTPDSLVRRRELSCELPRPLRAHFTQGEAAALVVIGREVKRGGECQLAQDAIAALAGVCKSVVKRALYQAEAMGLILVERRKLGCRRNDANRVTILSREWVAALRLGRPQLSQAAAAVARQLTQGLSVTTTKIQDLSGLALAGPGPWPARGRSHAGGVPAGIH